MLLAGAAILPLLLLSVVLGYFLVRHEEQLLRQAAFGRNRTFMTALDAQIQGYLGTLRALGASSSLASGNLQAFYDEAAGVLASQPDWRNILLVEQSGQQLINLRLGRDAALPMEWGATREALRAAMQSKHPTIGSLAPGPSAQGLGIAIRLPILRADEVPYVLQFILKPEALERLLRAQEYPRSWATGLLDAHRLIIARLPHRDAGEPASLQVQSALQRQPQGWYRGRSLEGTDAYIAYSTSSLTGWTVGVAIPRAEVSSAAYKEASVMLAGTALTLILAVGLAYWVARRFAEPIARLADAARALGRTSSFESLDAVSRDPRLREVLDVAVALREAQASLLERELLRQREQDALLAADRAKDEFLAMLGHELRNPLSSIVASAHVLRLSKPGAQAAAQANEVIDRQAKQMARLVEDLLDVSRLAMGKINLRRERTELGALTEQVVKTWLQTRPARRARLDCTVTVTYAEVDRARFEQILANLLDNADKFSPAGEGIRVRLARDAASVILEVEDDGQGIAPEDLPHVFDLFVQGPQPFDRPRGGLGLGLTLVKRLVEMHGGSVAVRSEGLGKGTLFTVQLPATAHPSAVADALPATIRPESRRILIVEDNEDGRNMLEAMLTLEGHTVCSAGTGEKAVQVAQAWHPDIALIDIGLPDFDGYEVARRLRQELREQAPKLIAISGFGQQSDLNRAYEAGFDLHLTKPVAPQFLRDVMSALTSRSQLQDASKLTP